VRTPGPRREPAHIGAGFDDISQRAELKCDAERRLCAFSSVGARLFAGVPVTRIEAAFQDSRLQQVNVTLDTLQFQALHHALTARYGAGEDCSFLAIAGMAAEFTARVFVWRLGTVNIVLEEYAGKIDRSALTFGSEATMADMLRKVHSYPRGARRDL
jgi:hypothetical protein